MAQAAPIDGKRLFYHYLQKDLQENDVWLFQMFTARLVVALGVWLHPDVYNTLPIMLPYAVRDPASRGNKKKGLPDAWGSPNADGFFRDDNSLVKTIPRALRIASAKNKLYQGRRIGRGFVAAHVWRKLPDGTLASRNPLTYSFVPNLVWLPAEVAALTDREGSFVQGYMQALSTKIYRALPVADPVCELAEEAWATLPAPPPIPTQGLPEGEDLNFFEPTAAWHQRRIAAIKSVVNALDAVIAGSPISGKVISARYTAGLADMDVEAAIALTKKLARSLETST